MSEEKKNAKVQIWIALIGLIGVLGAAIIGNLDKIISSTEKFAQNQPIIQTEYKVDSDSSQKKLDIAKLKDIGKQKHEDEKYSEAILAFKKVLEYQPNDIDTLQNIAHAYFLNKQYESALESIDIAIKIAPDNWKSYQLNDHQLKLKGSARVAED